MITLKQPRGLTAAFSSGALTATGAETVHDTTAAIVFSVDGALYSAASITDGTTPTTDGNTGAAFNALAANEGCAFVWCLSAATTPTVSVMQGPVTGLYADGEFKGGDAPQFPYIPDNKCPFAYQIVKNGSTGSAWTIGTSNWNATGITDLIVNVSTLPTRPADVTTA